MVVECEAELKLSARAFGPRQADGAALSACSSTFVFVFRNAHPFCILGIFLYKNVERSSGLRTVRSDADYWVAMFNYV